MPLISLLRYKLPPPTGFRVALSSEHKRGPIEDFSSKHETNCKAMAFPTRVTESREIDGFLNIWIVM